ncbi:Rieske (2Fe-2S) protein [Amycolatopsis mongoliensis]|uniref:Rieske (2Fe-2S) protein n=1 Tax=Amycolatopsis mongoliensis TaxID=715475 RepID=A0A9Y2JJX0_9PSEU|nr:Rieske (2Fe-2S) protein [Amycolatopsis sp. 4-36]WIX98658.1 Rieske (2Fe-2S) protein [Amycolatopsis sp. 4-36]
MNDVDRFAESLIRRRTPEPFQPDDEQAAQMRAAIELRAAHVGAADAVPDADFVARLGHRLADRLGAQATGTPHTRRGVVRTAGVAAASLAAGIGIDRLVRGPDTPAPLSPAAGTWRTVAASADLPAGGVREFELDTLTGFVQRTPDGLRAVSSTCTHLGCRLQLVTPERQLLCPCHGAIFALTGEIVRYNLPVDIPPLPHFQVREQDGDIQVYAPVERT